MMIGVSSRLLWESEKNLTLALDYVAKHVCAVELWMMPPFFSSWRTPDMKGDLDRVKDALTVYDLKTTIHAPHHDMNLASLNPSASSCAVREVEKCLEVADLLGSLAVTFHPGGYRYVREKGYAVLKANLARLDAKAKDHSVLVCAENMMPQNMYLAGSAEAADAVAGLENVHVTLDLAHALSQEEEIGEFIGRIGAKIRHVHISDFKGKEHTHLPIGEGDLDLAAGLAALKKSGYSGLFIIEGVPKNPYDAIPREVELLKKMLTDAGFI
jgi:sugar phosphate isomerase/epimerase